MTSRDDVLQNLSEHRQQKQQENMNGYETDKEDDVVARMKAMLQPIKYKGEIYYKHQGSNYKADEMLLKRIIREDPRTRTIKQVDEVYKRLMIDLIEQERGQSFPIVFENGYLEDGQFIFTDDLPFSPHFINRRYNPSAKPVKAVDEYLDHISQGDEGYRKYIIEMLGYIFNTNLDFKERKGKVFFIVGDGGSGKGTLLKLISMLLGAENVSNVSIHEFEDGRRTTIMIGKLANLGDDIEDQPINAPVMKTIKNMATADTVNIRKLYKESESTIISATGVYTSNHILRSFEKGESFKRRVVWLPLTKKLQNKSSQFHKDLRSEEALDYLTALAIESLNKLYETELFSESETIHEFNKGYHEANNTAVAYLKELNYYDILGFTLKEIYQDYMRWCWDNSLAEMPIQQLSQEIKRVFDVDLKGFMVNVNGEYKGNLVRSRSIRDREERKTYRMFVKNSDLELWTHGTPAVWEESNRRSKLDIEPNAEPSDEVASPLTDEEKEGIPDYR
ncbi:DNA primase family protein [Staphylococcus equorum]|uniref:DNA primase family protein n=1 Tax=Staphylococcus equorum TaxID=246432 RepID=UPI00255479FE|nr:phage/plasmid primase, P4 family [Staphylococcus equorum]MDK9857680.1 phage/plasmid primase, P4 family [Staphylococcus equorum]MDK9874740.1 phage/plasmid primase, P4 family [Staphylococcus equorum]